MNWTDIAPVVGLALVHLLWQGAIVGAAYAAVRPWLRRASAPARYGAACAALFALPALFAATLAGLAVGGRAGTEASGWALWVSAYAPLLVVGWMAGMALVAAYSVVGWGKAQQMCRRAAANLPEGWRAQAERLRQRFGIRRQVRLAVSETVSGPCALGCWRPWILLPLAAVWSLPPDHIEALLAHELAHIRRHDYVVNLLQRAVETVFFFHPVTWWLSRQVSEEREHCCDALAVEVCGDRAHYARVLVNLAEWRGRMVLAAGGGSLRRRVERVIAVPAATPRRAWVPALAATGLVMLLALSVGVPPRPTAKVAATPHINHVAATIQPVALSRAVAPPAPHHRRRTAVAKPVPQSPRAAALPKLQPQAVAFTTLALVPSCTVQTQMVPAMMPDGTVWLVPRRIRFCQPELRPVEVLVMTST